MTSHSTDTAALAAYVSDLRRLVTALEPFVVPSAPTLTSATWGDIRMAIYSAHVSLDRNLPDVRAWLAGMN